jgi:hypothetical protein
MGLHPVEFVVGYFPVKKHLIDGVELIALACAALHLGLWGFESPQNKPSADT